jgi:crossover junction endodeoxyribonuclease RuvC
MSEMIRILGIDPGLRRCGWGVVEVRGSKIRFRDCGTIMPDTKAEMSERLLHIFRQMCAVIETHQPHRAAIEDTFMNTNAASALKLGAARAAAMLAPAEAGLRVENYAPRAIKKALVGTGKADKNQMAAMVAILLPGCSAKADEADALAIAICSANHAPLASALEQAS